MSTVPNSDLPDPQMWDCGKPGCPTHFAAGPCPQTQADVEAMRRDDCPDWCVYDHRTDDERDDLILHQGDDHTDGVVRGLLDAHQLDIRVAQTGCPSEGTVDGPSLIVRVDAELKTWEQAAELARAILDGFGYLGVTEA